MDPYSLLLAFDSDKPEFGRGFEAGRIWGLLSSSDEPMTHVLHVNNAEMVLRMAEATGRAAQGEELGDGWVEVQFSAGDRGRLQELQ